jgi:hypothetical protein
MYTGRGPLVPARRPTAVLRSTFMLVPPDPEEVTLDDVSTVFYEPLRSL